MIGRTNQKGYGNGTIIRDDRDDSGFVSRPRETNSGLKSHITNN
jgi:hypothetical protein